MVGSSWLRTEDGDEEEDEDASGWVEKRCDPADDEEAIVESDENSTDSIYSRYSRRRLARRDPPRGLITIMSLY